MSCVAPAMAKSARLWRAPLLLFATLISDLPTVDSGSSTVIRELVVSLTSFSREVPISSQAKLAVDSPGHAYQELCAVHEDWPLYGHSGCLASLQRAVAAYRSKADAQRPQEPDREAQEFVGVMFKGPTKPKEHRLKRREAEKACRHQFEEDVGSIVRCLVQEGHAFTALREAESFLAKERPLIQSATKLKKQTIVLLEFALAHLMEQYRMSRTSELHVLELYKNFTRTAGQLHMYQDQLELLLRYAANRIRVLDPAQAVDLHLVRTRTNPEFLVAPLHPLVDTHLSVDVLRKGSWEEKQSVLVAFALNGTAPTQAEVPCLLVDVGANVGWFTFMAVALGCRVVAFEPVAQHCEHIRLAVAANGWSNAEADGTPALVELHETAALSDPSHRDLQMRTFAIGPAATSYVVSTSEPGRGREQVASERVDDAVLAYVAKLLGTGDRHGTCAAAGSCIPHGVGASVLKIDAEGCELEAMASAARFLRSFVPPPELFVELCPSLLKRCPGNARKAREDAAELLAEVYSHIYIYQVHGPGMLPSSSSLQGPWAWRVNGAEAWGVDGGLFENIYQLHGQAEGFLSYVMEVGQGCAYLWARSAELSELRVGK